jgi:tetratricopeptide (TPR) repeat protein
VSGWKSANIADIEKAADGRVPIREYFGGSAYGINAFVADNAGDIVINDHEEAHGGHEELYVVLEGHATFTVSGNEIDAPSGTIVFVRDPSAQRKAVAKDAGTMVLAVGGKPGAPFEVSAWEVASPWTSRGMALYQEQKYSEAADVFEEGLAAVPAHPGLRFNAACTRVLNGDLDAAFEHLRIAIEIEPETAEWARRDSDFDAVRDDPRFPA